MSPFLVLILLLLAGCASPRIIVLSDPLSAEEHNDLGVSYQSRGEFDLAVREYDRGAAKAPLWARPLVNRGNLYAGEKKWRRAEKSYRLALRREPECAEAMNNLAWVLLQSGEKTEALRWCEKAVAGAPDELAFYDTLAEIRIGLGDYGGALRALGRALELSPPPRLRASLIEKMGLVEPLLRH